MVGTNLTTNKAGLEKRTLVNQVYDCLRDRIVNLSLKPGEKIDVKGLARELSVSQTPIREALHKLAEQGLVEPKPYIGYFVTRLSQRDIQELFDLRSALETLALRYAFENISNTDLRFLLKQIHMIEGLKGEALVKETQEFDKKFHIGLILRNANGKWLIKYVNGILDLIALTTRLSINPLQACDEHRRILEALLRRDLAGATSLLEAHLQRAKRDSVSAIEKNGSTKGGGE